MRALARLFGEEGVVEVRSDRTAADAGTWTPDATAGGEDGELATLDGRDWDAVRVIARFDGTLDGSESVTVTPLLWLADPESATAGRRWIAQAQITLAPNLAHAVVQTDGHDLALRIDALVLGTATDATLLVAGGAAEATAGGGGGGGGGSSSDIASVGGVPVAAGNGAAFAETRNAVPVRDTAMGARADAADTSGGSATSGLLARLRGIVANLASLITNIGATADAAVGDAAGSLNAHARGLHTVLGATGDAATTGTGTVNAHVRSTAVNVAKASRRVYGAESNQSVGTGAVVTFGSLTAGEWYRIGNFEDVHFDVEADPSATAGSVKVRGAEDFELPAGADDIRVIALTTTGRVSVTLVSV